MKSKKKVKSWILCTFAQSNNLVFLKVVDVDYGLLDVLTFELNEATSLTKHVSTEIALPII